MSALHRLKAYFGMVPAEEFDAAEFDDYQPGCRSGYPNSGDDSRGYAPGFGSGLDRAAVNTPTANAPRERDYAAERPGVRRPHRAAFDDYDDGFATRAGHHAAPRMYPTRSPSWATEPRAAESRGTDPWAAEAPVRGSLAIDPAAIDAATINTRPTVRQPVAPERVTPVLRTGLLTEDPLAGEDDAYPLARIVTLHPHSYNEARPIGERYREGNPVIMNLTGMADRDAKRLVDFAAGLAFALRGSIDKVTNKVFLLSPPNVDVSAEDRRRIAEGRFFN
ncbi:MAG TPA: cell division protein SepF [Pseudonocardiaceae bacterium]|nr:cell division protein SepF [Pseudonocardiaceae bacterium]